MKPMYVFPKRPYWSMSLLMVLLVGVISLVGSPSLLANTTPSDYDVGENDFLISNFFPNTLAVAYNSQNHEYLVVWDSLGPDDIERVYGQRIDAASGAKIKEEFGIIAPDMLVGERQTSFSEPPGVVYNPTTNEYLVTWSRNTFRSGEIFKSGIYGQRLDAETGAEIGANDFRIDDPTNPYYSISKPNVTYNSRDNEYLVVWAGNQLNVFPEILVGQRLDVDGQRLGELITAIGDSAPRSIDDLDIAYNSGDNEYLVVWNADEPEGLTSLRIQRLDATTGAEVGANDIRISAIGEGEGFIALEPAVAYNETAQEYLVVWVFGGPDAFNDRQIHGQRVNAAGEEVGTDDFVISQFGSPDGGVTGRDPAVVYNPTDHEYLVTWTVVDSFVGPFPKDRESEAYGQLLDGSTGAEIGINDFRISEYGTEGDQNDRVFQPTSAYNEQDNEYLVIWLGTDGTEDSGIFGQRLSTDQESVVAPRPAQEQQTRVYLPLTIR